jgi:hypothetical protein
MQTLTEEQMFLENIEGNTCAYAGAEEQYGAYT